MNLDLLKTFAKNVSEQKTLKEKYTTLITPEMAQIEVRMKTLKTEEASMRPEVVKHLKTQEVDKYSAGFGTFSILPNKVWQYSPAYEEAKKKIDAKVKELQDRLVELRKEEKTSGKAKEIDSEPTLRFQAAKS